MADFLMVSPATVGSFWDEDGYRSLCGDSLAAAGEAQSFGGCGLNRHACGIDAQKDGETRDHRRSVRRNLRALTDQRHIGVGQPAAAGCDTLGGVLQEPGAVGV